MIQKIADVKPPAWPDVDRLSVFECPVIMNRTTGSQRVAKVFWSLCASALLPAIPEAAAPESEPSAAANLLMRANAAFKQGDLTNAIEWATKAIAADPANAAGYALRGSIHEKAGQHAKAIADLDQVLKRQPDAAAYYQRRGVEHFRSGHFKEAVADFDKAIELNPRFEPQHWQRGIACYYAGQFEKGRRQFELHQTVNDRDVENAAWHFLCVARVSGVDKARASLIPIEGDSRIPMKEIHELYAGKIQPEAVLAAAGAGASSPERVRNHLFYAHLYLGLYFEAGGNAKAAREHISKAARDFENSDYMGDVARVHFELLQKSARKAEVTAP
jgi:lipoprotein NlpI